MSKAFLFHFEPETYQHLTEFADATHKTKSEAIRTAILIASSLFANRKKDSMELETQGQSDVVLTD